MVSRGEHKEYISIKKTKQPPCVFNSRYIYSRKQEKEWQRSIGSMVNYLQTVQSFMWSVHYRVGQFQTFFKFHAFACCLQFPWVQLGKCNFFLILVNQFFEQNASFLWAKEQKSNSLMKKSESLPLLSHKEWGSLFCNEQREQFAFGH